MTDSDKQTDPAPQAPPRTNSPLRWIVLLLLGLATLMLLKGAWDSQPAISYSQFLEQLRADNIAKVTIRGKQVSGDFRRPLEPTEPAHSDASDTDQQQMVRFTCTLPPQVGESLLEQLDEKRVVIVSEDPAEYDHLFMIFSLVALVLLFFFAWTMIRRTRDQMLGGGMLGGMVKSPARRYDAEKDRITFDDVAGLEGVKKDLQEIIQFLEAPEKFHRLGAQVPKGVLLMGPPGTGKTLLARAVAGEAGVPFYSINGSEFIQMFVGVGASRVRDLFKTAQNNAPAIVFIDEIDAIGRQRGAGLGGGHDEREQTLNQILSEMDGFSTTSSVIVLAGTNRPDVLDPALLRPGRFDRHVTVDRPALDGRRELFELHSRKVPVSEDVDFQKLARATVGLTGADIRNLVNEAALWATRHDKDKVDMSDFEYARDKVLMGARRDEVLTEKEKKIVAYHEAGHAILAWLIPGSDTVHKVTIIPRGRSLGVTQLVPEEDSHNPAERELVARLTMGLGGRAAEKMLFNEYSVGAESDLKSVTALARRMVTRWGMSERLGPVAYGHTEEQPFLGRELAHEHRDFSEHTARVIDEEVAKILHAAADRARTILQENRDKLDAVAEALLEREVLDTDELKDLIGPPVRSLEQAAGDMTNAATSRQNRVQPQDEDDH
jgi:cell division protease FtsH